tara:strand:+ start:1314 stop:1535 length:222 start_codon:yes stop_codon:yes gene_type:complete
MVFNVDEYKIGTIFTALIGGVGVLWHQLIKQVSLNRSDQKEFTKLLSRNMEVLAETNELMRDIKDIIRHERNK